MLYCRQDGDEHVRVTLFHWHIDVVGHVSADLKLAHFVKPQVPLAEA